MPLDTPLPIEGKRGLCFGALANEVRQYGLNSVTRLSSVVDQDVALSVVFNSTNNSVEPAPNAKDRLKVPQRFDAVLGNSQSQAVCISALAPGRLAMWMQPSPSRNPPAHAVKRSSDWRADWACMSMSAVMAARTWG